jgi:SAM-dependent methyltransferase
MLEAAQEILSGLSFSTHLGSSEQLVKIPDQSVDLILCVDAFDYLTVAQQTQFFEESYRVLRHQGGLIITAGNELLDFFALNAGTADFFRDHFQLDVQDLLTLGGEARWVNSGRRNPLTFGGFLSRFGFDEVGQAFSQWHKIPPGLATVQAEGDYVHARMAARDNDFDPTSLPEELRWQALFRCSSFASLSLKRPESI